MASDKWGDNLLTNGGFETWSGTTLGTWTATVTGASAITKETTLIKEGDSSCKLTVAAGVTALITQMYAFVPGTLYKLSFFVRATVKLPIRVRTNSTGAETLNESYTVDAVNTWYLYKAIFRAAAADVMVRIENNSSSYVFYADDVQLRKWEPTTLAL